MGLTEITISAASSSARRGIYSCEILSDSVLLAVGRRPAEPSGGNLLDHGGKLKVSEGQCALLVSRGKVTDFCAEPGTYAFDAKQPPFPKLGPLEDQVRESWQHLSTSSGVAGSQQLFFVNLRSVPGLDFRRETPFRLMIPADMLDVDVNLLCSGHFTYRVSDPVLFYTSVTGSVEDRFDNAELNETLCKEVILQLQVVLAKLAADGRTFPHRAAFGQAIAEGMEEELSLFWPGLRGIVPDSVTIDNVYARDREGDFFARWLATGEKEAETRTDSKEWFCPDCGAASTGNFCPQCGKKKPEI